MKTFSPTLVICSIAFVVGAALLALPARSVEKAGETDSATAGPTDALVIESFAFSVPSVSSGATIAVANRDGVEHTVTFDDGSVDSTIAAGAVATFTAPLTPGSYTFVCVIHPSMTASLVVT